MARHLRCLYFCNLEHVRNFFRLPKTICFGRGSTKAFQKDFTKQDKNKKKSKKKMENSMQHTCQEVLKQDANFVNLSITTDVKRQVVLSCPHVYSLWHHWGNICTISLFYSTCITFFYGQWTDIGHVGQIFINTTRIFII